MEDMYIILNAKDKQIAELEKKLEQKNQIIQAQKQALDYIWSRLEDKQFQLDRYKEHSKQIKMKL